jgi:hypothetical protein
MRAFTALVRTAHPTAAIFRGAHIPIEALLPVDVDGRFTID